MTEAYICDYIRTPIGRFGGALSAVRPDDLGAIVLKALAERNGSVDLEAVDDVIFGNANQAGEDNRNVARMSLLLADYPVSVTGTTINRLCGSGLDAVLVAARAIKAGEADLIIAGGTESMSRAPFVMPKATSAFSRNAEIYDTTIGWRFVNPVMKKLHGVDPCPKRARTSPRTTRFPARIRTGSALASQTRAAAAQAMEGWQRRSLPSPFPSARAIRWWSKDEHPAQPASKPSPSCPRPSRKRAAR